MAKLTLNVDPDVIHAAKAYAEAQQVSLSHLVTQFLRTLPAPAPEFWTQLHAALLQEGFQELGDDTETLRQCHLQRKYR